MLKGYTVPRSPLGIAELDPPPPWHYSSDVIALEYWADPKATAATLPPGLSPDPTTNGRAWMMFLDWQFTGEHDEYLDPARYQYREAFVLVEAMWGTTPVNYCPYIFVDNDAALARGWIQVSHPDTDYYDRYFRNGLTGAQRGHFEHWHAPVASLRR